MQVHEWLRAPDRDIRLPLLWSSDYREEGEVMSVKIELEVSEECESTAFPWWMIIDPAQNFKTGERGVYNVAFMVTGPFFSREEAERVLQAQRYNFGTSACVYCHSGTYSPQYVKAMRAGKKVT